MVDRARSEAKAIIDLQNISKTYPGVHALKEVDFSLHSGEVHCLVGSNGSGKSTLIKIISGVESQDSGLLSIKGRAVDHHSSRHAHDEGIQVIYQDLALFPNLSVGENIAFHLHFAKPGIVSWSDVDRTARKAMALIGLDIDPDRRTSTLSIAQQQLVEICRCLTGNLSLLILDEPTSSLTRKEVRALFAVIEKLKEQGIAILFISHKLNEVFEIAEFVTIIRDGDIIGTYHPQELHHEKLVYLMTGSNEKREAPSPYHSSTDPLLTVKHLSKKRNYEDVSFTLQRGEILGITGLLGSGRTELALSLFGMSKADSGEIYVDGTEVSFQNNLDALKVGIGYVPENRREDGLIFDQSIEDNITVTTLGQHLGSFSLIDDASLHAASQHWAEHLAIKIPRFDAPIQTLSGGNQQKVVLAKWLAMKPNILILDEPTIGIDVIAKNSIHRLIKQLAAAGMGLIVISDEIQEVLHNVHRVIIMEHGRMVHEFFPDEVDEAMLLKNFNLA